LREIRGKHEGKLVMPFADISMEVGGLAGLGAALLAGFLFSFNPVSFASLPMVLAYVTKARSTREAVLFGGSFALGMIVTHMVLGVAAALGGQWIESFMGRAWLLLLGPVLIFMGLAWPGWIKLPLPWVSLRGERVATASGAFFLAAGFTIGICPLCSPGLWIALGASASIGSPLYGALLLFIFALGRTLPLLVGAFSIGWLESLKPLAAWRAAFETIGGVTLILVGIYVLNDYFLWL
jgi:cytochrome c-type biogenesis protein